MKRFWLTVIFFTIASAIFIFGFRQKSSGNSPSAVNGILDISHVDLSSDIVILEGQWEFYWMELLSPDLIPQTSGNYVSIPSAWDDIELEGSRLTGDGYATYRLRIFLPKHRPQLGLRIPDVYSSYRFYINHQLISQNGVPATKKEEAVPFWRAQTISLPVDADTLDCVMQVANFWTSRGGMYKAPKLADLQVLNKSGNIDRMMDAFLSGSIFICGLLFLGLYLFTRDDKSILYFSLFCIIYCYRIIGTEPYHLHEFINNLSWFITIRFEFGSLSLSVAFFSLYIYYLYPEENNRTLVRTLFWISILYTAVIGVAPVKIFTVALPVYLWLLFFYIAYALYVFARASRSRRNGSDFAFLSTGVIIILFFIINLNYFEIIYPVKASIFWGYLIFLFLQAIILSHRVSYRLKKSAEEARQGLKAKTEFLSTMSHEIRTPLNGIIGLVHILINTEPEKSQKDKLKTILFSAKSLLKLVNDILDYSKMEEKKMELELIQMNLREIGENIIKGEQKFAADKAIDLSFEMDSHVPEWVYGDPVRITQVITNLVHNAIKFTEKGWVKLIILCEKSETHQALLKIVVNDSGIGISPEEQKIIFKRFKQADSSTSRKYGGTGLGLAICQKILNLYHTELQLKSEPGKGSSFWFTLSFPVVNVSEALPSVSLVKEDKPLMGYSILIAEDNELNAMIVKTILEDFGAETELAVNGRDAIEKFKPTVHRVIIMDLNMPEMDGFEATEYLRNAGVTIPVIALTATSAKENIEMVMESGITDVITKPFDPEELCRIIIRYEG